MLVFFVEGDIVLASATSRYGKPFIPVRKESDKPTVVQRGVTEREINGQKFQVVSPGHFVGLSSHYSSNGRSEGTRIPARVKGIKDQ